jgi:hypothetical protein
MDSGREVTRLGVPVAGRCAEDAFVVGGIGAEAELALDAAAEVGRPHERAVGVTDSRAEREGVGCTAVGRPGQRNGQVWHERVPLRAACLPERDQSVIDGGQCRHCHVVVRLRRVTARQGAAHFSQCAAAVAGRRERARRHPDAGSGRHDPHGGASHRDDPVHEVRPRVDAVERGVELIGDPDAIPGRHDRTRPVTHADSGSHLAGRRVEPVHREVE